jgi:NADH-quinone oxidoreductase subunit M
MATLGLPGMGNFVAEFLILAGSFIKSPLLVSLAAIGLIIGVIYALRLVQKIFKGPATLSFIDFNIKEKILASVLIVVIIFIGVYPKPIINKTKRSIYKILEYTKPENRHQPTIIVVPNEANV